MKALSLILILISAVAHAGGTKVGNGGSGVVCKNRSDVQLLDIYEAEQAYGLSVSTLFDGGLDSDFDELRRRAAIIFPKGHAIFEIIDSASRLPLTMRLVDELELTEDVGSIQVLEPDCRLQQAAVQTFLGVQIRRNFWGQSSPKQQALLLFHESLHTYYQLYPKSGWMGTLAIRQIVSLFGALETEFRPRADLVRRLVETNKAVSPDEIRSPK